MDHEDGHRGGRKDASQTLTPAIFHILLALGAGELHGYGVMQEVAAFTNGQVRLGPGTLYRSIKQMLALGLIVESDERPDPSLDDERRRYYRLTDAGRMAAQTEAQRLERLVREAREKRLLGGEGQPGGLAGTR